MCFLTKCPYVPPHELDIDFPHLILRYRAIDNKKKNLEKIKSLPKNDQQEATTKFEEETYNKKQDVLPQTNRTILKETTSFVHQVYSDTDSFSPLSSSLSTFGITNSVIQKKVPASFTRTLMENVTGIGFNFFIYFLFFIF